jgi:ribosomal protein L20
VVAVADGHNWSKKTYNNAITVLKRAFDFGYRDRPFHENPALNLRCARLRKADRPKVDPFSMHDAETLIAAIHHDRRILSDTSASSTPMAPDPAIAEGALPTALHRAPDVGELESYGW